MIKFYFDWNCITHSKDRLGYLLDLIDTYGAYMVCPFSIAHIRDALVSRENTPYFFKEDLDLLHTFCGNHFLQYDGERIIPQKASPQEVVEKEGDLWEFIQKFELINHTTYYSLKKLLQSTMPKSILDGIQKENDPSTVISKIDAYIQSELHQSDIASFMSASNPLAKINTLETQFKNICMALDIFGYKSEGKSKTIMNIEADAAHMFMAAHCDYLVTDDRKMRDNAATMYSKYGFVTRIISPPEVESVVKKSIEYACSKDYILSCITSYGKGREEADGVHYKLLPYPVFGLFNCCVTKSPGVDEPLSAFLMYGFGTTPYLFYSEIETFLNWVKQLLPQSAQSLFWENYAAPLMSNDREHCLNYTITIANWNAEIILAIDPNQLSAIPLMQITFK